MRKFGKPNKSQIDFSLLALNNTQQTKRQHEQEKFSIDFTWSFVGTIQFEIFDWYFNTKFYITRWEYVSFIYFGITSNLLFRSRFLVEMVRINKCSKCFDLFFGQQFFSICKILFYLKFPRFIINFNSSMQFVILSA